MSNFCSIPDAIKEITAGRILIVIDDEDRENEGDFIMAADQVTPESINFMARYGRGLICLPTIQKRLEELKIPAMVGDQDNTAILGTRFTVSVDAVNGTTTGISAHDRAETIKVFIRPDSKPEDLARPGHIFPLQAFNGGVLRRAGHTEATCDLARLAGFHPVGVLCEIMDDDGSYSDTLLREISNFLNSKYTNKSIDEIKRDIQSDINSSKGRLEALSKTLVQNGILGLEPSSHNPYIFLHGQSSLLEDEIVSKDLDQIRKLFDEIENKTSFVDILENTNSAKGVQIFIGSQNFLFKHSGLSMVMAPYKNKEQKIIGAIGVVGPTRLNYAKIVPLVDYTSKIIGKVLS